MVNNHPLSRFYISGVLQGSVLGPLLFLIYINDSACEALNIGSHIALYADNILLYRVISSPADYVTLQTDVDSLSNWVLKNKVQIYGYIKTSKERSACSPITAVQSTFGYRVSSYKYLRVNNLMWSAHIDEIFSKARRIFGLLCREFYAWSSPQALLQLYTSPVRPHLEYASQVWNPHLIRHADQLERIQKFALKVCFKQWNSSYSELLELSTLPSLLMRRKLLNLVCFYKLVNNLFQFPNCPLALRSLHYPSRSGR